MKTRLVLLLAAALFTLPPLTSCRESSRQESLSAARATPSPPAEPAVRNVLHSPLAGTWYEADASALSLELTRYLDAAANEKEADEKLADVGALILPHAGYRWSGAVAAAGLQQLAGRHYDRVVVIGPSHRVPMENLASVPAATHYATPLGETPLDAPLLAKLRQHAIFQTIANAHDGEHSVQIQLPLLQQALGQFRFVPIVVGQLDLDAARKIARILCGVIDENTLVVASSDFTHYGANFGYYPFRDDVAERLRQLDMGAVEQIRRRDLVGLYDYISQTQATICGRHAIGVLLAMLPADAEAHLLKYDTSGRISGDYASSVSYCAIAFSRVKWPPAAEVPPDTSSARLSDDDQRQLLRLARATLEYTIKNGERPTAEQVNFQPNDATEMIAGAFVTLRKHGQLRGCIGEITPLRPLYQVVMDHAVNAGVNDRRFLPADEAELSELTYEVSVLTPPREVPSPEEIEIGRHGVILRKDDRAAVFLPQVAIEQGWDRTVLLNHLAQKAGLAEDAWRRGASLAVFEAIVIGEGDP